MEPPRRIRPNPIAFEDRTTPDERPYGLYLIRSAAAGYAETFTGSYRTARKLAPRRTQYGEIELVFIEPQDTPAIDWISVRAHRESTAMVARGSPRREAFARRPGRWFVTRCAGARVP